MGIATPLKDLRAYEWIAEGGEYEDEPVRFLRHFHDPLVSSWALSGLEMIFDSSLLWMQLDDGVDAGTVDSGQGWSWPDARRAYYHALTFTAKPDRDQKWADTFRALGQIMHLVEDAAQPEHTHNDSHMSYEYAVYERYTDQPDVRTGLEAHDWSSAFRLRANRLRLITRLHSARVLGSQSVCSRGFIRQGRNAPKTMLRKPTVSSASMMREDFHGAG